MIKNQVDLFVCSNCVVIVDCCLFVCLFVAETSGNEWNSVSSRSLWSQIADEAMAQYHFEIKL